MILCDVNIYVHAHREDSTDHKRIYKWMESVLDAGVPFGVSEFVLSSFVRIVTHPKIFETPSPMTEALAFADQVRSHPDAIIVVPGERHWEIFTDLCKDAKATGNLIPDAYLAAMAVEHQCTWITLDRDFARFPDLDWQEPKI